MADTAWTMDKHPIPTVRVGVLDPNDMLAGRGLVQRFDWTLYKRVVKARNG